MTDLPQTIAHLRELKPCPLCGGSKITIEDCSDMHTNGDRIACDNCGCSVEGHGGSTSIARAVLKWNTRAPAPVVVEHSSTCASRSHLLTLPPKPRWCDCGKEPVVVDWVEDATHENGNYMRDCVSCGAQFIGHKRRSCCKKCATAHVQPNGELPKIADELELMAKYIDVNPDNVIVDTLWHGPAETTYDALLRIAAELRGQGDTQAKETK